MTALSDLLKSSNTGGVSARSVSRKAQSLGFTLNHDTAARYLRGDHGRPDEPTLQAFSAALEIPLTRLREAAGLPSEQTAPYVPPTEASRLNRRQRKAVDEIIRAMLEPAESAGVRTSTGADGTASPLGTVSQFPSAASSTAERRAAARRGKGEKPTR
ncbi:hypothetical protein M6D93_17005 [Jatrophihabitans telluris]|uniref:XRE family transcriptional regulator n=1 Tax=Jatrophihabitans telluris TaxID=2038343 RepID=A0ABY4QXQ0_9ACTN|nr:hypothetical protein [Jatrophihabitans telluris]UQX87982.1 hypothetical protein M6D93_17005 [Jatrophihabitans telluris]